MDGWYWSNMSRHHPGRWNLKWVFQMDNDHKHTTKLVTKWLKVNKVFWSGYHKALIPILEKIWGQFCILIILCLWSHEPFIPWFIYTLWIRKFGSSCSFYKLLFTYLRNIIWAVPSLRKKMYHEFWYLQKITVSKQWKTLPLPPFPWLMWVSQYIFFLIINFL